MGRSPTRLRHFLLHTSTEDGTRSDQPQFTIRSVAQKTMMKPRYRRVGNLDSMPPEADLSGSTSQVATETSAALLRELVSHLRQNRTQMREEWARRITDAQL